MPGTWWGRGLNNSKDDMVQPRGHANTERHLARGLDDVSNIFLSQTNEKSSAATAEGNPSEGSHPQPPELAVSALLHPLPGMSRDRLVSFLEIHSAVLEEGVRTIDANIPCAPHGTIDLLAVDGSNHLVVIDLDDSPNDALLLRGVSHFDWLVHSVPILRRMYRGHVIDFSSDPRLFLVAPDYSPSLRCAARWMARPQILRFRYRTAALRNSAAILVERD